MHTAFRIIALYFQFGHQFLVVKCNTNLNHCVYKGSQTRNGEIVVNFKTLPRHSHFRNLPHTQLSCNFDISLITIPKYEYNYNYMREICGNGLSTEMKASDTLTKIIVFCLRLPFLVFCSYLSTALKSY
jgi:hypothetical protein